MLALTASSREAKYGQLFRCKNDDMHGGARVVRDMWVCMYGCNSSSISSSSTSNSV